MPPTALQLASTPTHGMKMGMAIFHRILALCGLFLISSTAAELQTREATCRSILIKPGDTCATLAAKCGITTTEFSNYNTEPFLCSSLTAGKPVCCSSGALELPPEAGSDGLCYSYTLQADDNCTSIADGYEITVDEIKAYNNATFGWDGCKKLDQGSFICLSPGSPPMPVSLPDAICGPQVPGTTRPSNMSDLDEMNPCLDTNCKCNLNVGKCYNTVDFNSGCATEAAAATVSTSTAKAATTTSTKSKLISSKTKFTLTDPTATSTKTSSTSPEKEATDSDSKIESATTLTTSIVQITKVSWTKSTSTTPTTSIIEITTASSTSKPSTIHTTATHTSSSTTSAPKTTTTTQSASTITSAAASTSAYKPWEVAMYSEKDCEGDYYLLSGINLDYSSNCLGLHSGLSSAFTEKGTWCRWYTNGGSTSTDCDAGTLETPVSWYLTNAMCLVFPSENCTNTNGTAQAYTSAGGSRCNNYADAAFKVSPWGSLWCSGVDSEYL